MMLEGKRNIKETHTAKTLIYLLSFLYNIFFADCYDLEVLCFLAATSEVLTCKELWGPVFHCIPELSITLEDTVT